MLQNEQMAGRSFHGNDFQVSNCQNMASYFDNDEKYRHFMQYLGQRGPYTQSAMHAFDRNTGIIFYSQVYTNGFGCWNSNTPHSPSNFHVLERNNQTMIYPSDLNVSRIHTI